MTKHEQARLANKIHRIVFELKHDIERLTRADSEQLDNHAKALDHALETLSDIANQLNQAAHTVNLGNRAFPMNAVVNLMDDDLREELHSSQYWQSDQQFVDAYCKAHKKRFGEDFVIN